MVSKDLSKIVKNLVFNPGMFWEVCLRPRGWDTFYLVLISFSFLPLIQRRFSAYFLAIPLLAVNLLADWFPNMILDTSIATGSSNPYLHYGLADSARSIK